MMSKRKAPARKKAIAWGGESEAAEHVRGWCSLWAEYPDAIAALAKVAKVPTS